MGRLGREKVSRPYDRPLTKYQVERSADARDDWRDPTYAGWSSTAGGRPRITRSSRRPGSQLMT
jgi:hypothetical protein